MNTTCAACGIVFGIPDDLMTKLQQTGNEFWCPNGHSLWFHPSENDKLKKKNRELSKELSYTQEELSFWRNEAGKNSSELHLSKLRVAGYKGQLARVKKSITKTS